MFTRWRLTTHRYRRYNQSHTDRRSSRHSTLNIRSRSNTSSRHARTVQVYPGTHPAYSTMVLPLGISLQFIPVLEPIPRKLLPTWYTHSERCFMDEPSRVTLQFNLGYTRIQSRSYGESQFLASTEKDDSDRRLDAS
jgi:hypothetical protein